MAGLTNKIPALSVCPCGRISLHDTLGHFSLNQKQKIGHRASLPPSPDILIRKSPKSSKGRSLEPRNPSRRLRGLSDCTKNVVCLPRSQCKIRVFCMPPDYPPMLIRFFGNSLARASGESLSRYRLPTHMRRQQQGDLLLLIVKLHTRLGLGKSID